MPVLDDDSASSESPAEHFGLLPEEVEVLSLAASASASLRIRRQLVVSFIPTGALMLVFAACALSLFVDLA